jgi:hygromycin-B 7''-O-kinase
MMAQYEFTSVKDYERVLTNVAFWRSAIDRLCTQHPLFTTLTDVSIRAGLPGTNPVFIVDERFVIKFYEIYLFPSGNRSFRVELDLYEWLQLPDLMIPQLIASGTPDNWPYIITKIVPGLSFGEVHTKIHLSDRHALATLLGHTLRYLHQIPIDSQPILSKMRDEFIEFVQKQENECVQHHRQWRVLPEHLIEQIPKYLHDHERLKSVSLIHADISCDHVFGTFDSEHEYWHATGLIDFADAWVGDPAYELVTLHCSLFGLDTNLLRTFLRAYQLLQEPFIERVMVAILLFEFNVFKNVAEHRSAAFFTVSTLQELAESIWAMEDS